MREWWVAVGSVEAWVLAEFRTLLALIEPSLVAWEWGLGYCYDHTVRISIINHQAGIPLFVALVGVAVNIVNKLGLRSIRFNRFDRFCSSRKGGGVKGRIPVEYRSLKNKSLDPAHRIMSKLFILPEPLVYSPLATLTNNRPIYILNPCYLSTNWSKIKLENAKMEAF